MGGRGTGRQGRGEGGEGVLVVVKGGRDIDSIWGQETHLQTGIGGRARRGVSRVSYQCLN